MSSDHKKFIKGVTYLVLVPDREGRGFKKAQIIKL